MNPLNLVSLVVTALAATITSIPVACLMMAYVMSEGEQILTGTWMDRNAIMIVQPNWYTLNMNTDSEVESVVTTTVTSITVVQPTTTNSLDVVSVS